MAEPDLTALGQRAEAMIRALSVISAEEGRITRLYLTPQHRHAADLVGRWMAEAGLQVSEDALGTVRGRVPRAGTAARRLLIGSHIDTVNDAGAYDGTFGVIAGILAIDEILKSSTPLSCEVDLLAFGDEEGSRFPATLLCSSAVAGHFDFNTLQVESVDGVSLDAALRAYGKDPAQIAEAAYDPKDIAAYVEVHIEQGPVLERQDEALGVVTAIAGQSRLMVTVIGEAGHAGTVPMAIRRDAYAASAEMALVLETIARENAADFMVGTVGKLTLAPGTANVIPARVTFTVDMRSQTDGIRHAALTRFRSEVQSIADRRRVTAWVERSHEAAAIPCDPGVQDLLAKAVVRQGGEGMRLPSGAGHDGQAIGRLCPIGMMFVRCRGGISHNPAEYCSPEDMGKAIGALIDFVRNFKA